MFIEAESDGENMGTIAENMNAVQQRICTAAHRVGRAAKDIRLITVTKTIDCARIREAIAAGAVALGENRVQEVLEKYGELPSENPFHLIGHLQTNKVKYIIDKVELIHSLESVELAKEIEKRAAGIGKVQPVLVQVNVSGEESKFGIAPEKCMEFCTFLNTLEHLQIKGLMTMAPFGAAEPELRSVFSGLRKLAGEIADRGLSRIEMTELSMGMSGDFEIAVEEGATMVRVGTGIFGKRI